MGLLNVDHWNSERTDPTGHAKKVQSATTLMSYTAIMLIMSNLTIMIVDWVGLDLNCQIFGCPS